MRTSIQGTPVAPHSFQEKENRCRAIFDSVIWDGFSFWHVCTPGSLQSIIFESVNDYEFGMVAAALAAHESGVRIVTFELMSNHVHFILCCKHREDAQTFPGLLKKKLVRYLRDRTRIVDLSSFACAPIAIETLESLRNQIAYTNRNNFVVDSNQTPFSYPYGANQYYFNPLAKSLRGVPYGSLSQRAKIRLIHSKETDYPETLLVTGNYFSPASFCDISLGESMFRDARHYMYKITRDIESYKDLSAILGDLEYYTDDELVGIVYSICRQKYGSNKPSQLPAKAKEELAAELHFDYRADNEKIHRLLSIPLQTLKEKFP